MGSIAVIGGGAAGFMAAVTAAETGAEEVYILENKDRPFNKLRSTGNGRCNFTNLAQEPICYRCDNVAFPWPVIEKFDEKAVIAFFLRLGIYSRNRNGYLYPQSDQASAVADVLKTEARRLDIKILTGHKASEIVPGPEEFLIRTGAGQLKADKVILAAGSKAAPHTGSDGSGYGLAKTLGHHIVPVLPALVQLRCREKFFKVLSGIRAYGKVSLFVGKECMACDTGEIQLTEYGISGIPAFQVSRYASIGLHEKKDVYAVLNFMPDFTEKQFLDFLIARKNMRPKKPMEKFLIGLFHSKLSALWLREAKINPDKKAGECKEEELERLRSLIQNFKAAVIAVNSFEYAQVCRGGIDTKEIDNETMESLIVPGLYFAGEIIDVDGICGGYNLQWAWSSGHLAGKSAAEDTINLRNK